MHVCPKLCAGCAANMSNNSSTTAISFFLQPVLRVYHSSTMLSSKVSLLSCQNPFCLNFNKKPFVTQAAYTQHIDRNIGCYNFIVRKSHVAAPHGASISRRCSLHEDGLVTWTSNKRPSRLRRHVVNDVPDAGDLAVGDGADVVSDDHTRDDFSVLGDDPIILTCGSTAFDRDVEATSFRSNFMYTTDQKWTVSLLKILDHANAPDYTFGEVLEWARSSSANILINQLVDSRVPRMWMP